MMESATRREVLRAGGLLAAGLAVPGLLAGHARAALARPARERVLRLAHMTDCHIQPERSADQGVTACLKHVQALPDKPQMVLTGGDLVMDSFETPYERTMMLWDVWTRVLKDNCGLPVEHCLGNHDVFGWNKKKAKTTGAEPRYGKKMALEVLGLAKSYRRFERAGWTFIVLDSIFPEGEGYIGRLDDEQMAWLEGEIKGATGPVLVVSHIPILAVCATFNHADQKGKVHKTGFGEMHGDSPALHKLFRESGKVKLCLSGHIHRNDRVELDGVTYICDGAVSGAWWRGREDKCDEGYGVVDLFSDGGFEHQYIKYGWTARK